jgi:membrane protease YdiL (CAAX protease family)
MRHLVLGLLAVLVAIGATTAMDMSGFTAFSALILIIPFAALWIIGRYRRQEVGFVFPNPLRFLPGIIHPLIVLPVLGIAAYASGDGSLTEFDLARTAQFAALVAGSTFLVTLVTEEGLFRGSLWAALNRGGFGPQLTVLLTSLFFAAWHYSFATLAPGHELPAAQVPVYLANAFTIGAIWAVMRLRSGSVLVPALAHGIWNGAVYILFGLSTQPGALAIENTGMFGPEVGYLGLALNVVFLAGYIFFFRARPPSETA